MRQHKHFLLIPLAFSMFVSAAGAQSCEELKVADRLSLPDGQAAATITGPLKSVEVPSQHLAIPKGPLSSVRISLDRTACYGACPDYAVELNGDGTASFTGRRFVLVQGRHTFKVSEQSIRCLLSHFNQADFWSLKNKYIADITDGPQYRLDLTIGGKTKSVDDYFGLAVGMPRLVNAIEREIDHTADVDRWVKGTAATMPSLRDEHFDFHSKDAATLLANAAAGAPTEFISSLIDAGTPVTGRIKNKGPTAIEQASGGGRMAVVQALIARGAFNDGLQDTKDGALRAAAASGDPQIVAEILVHRPNVNSQDPLFGNTALSNAQRTMRSGTGASNVDAISVVRLLLAAGAEPNFVNGNGRTALFGSSNADIVHLLLKSGANVNVRDRFGDTPLISAGSDEVAVILIEAGANTAAIGWNGRTVTKMLEIKGYTKALQHLRERKR